MSAWTKETRALWEKLALGGARIEKRYVGMRGQRLKGEYAAPTWFIAYLPVTNYMNGPYRSKSHAVRRAALYMGLLNEEELP